MQALVVCRFNFNPQEIFVGYYFEKAKTTKELSSEQLARYKELRSADQIYPPELLHRIVVIKEHIGPVYNGETWSAYDELAQDTFVTWILANEDPSKVQWSHPELLIVIPPPLTSEEKEAARLRTETFYQKLQSEAEEQKRIDREGYEAVRVEYEQGLNFFQKILNRFSPLYPPYDEL